MGGGGTDKQAALLKYFGYLSFRGGQEKLVDAVLSRRDVLGVMPTGAGKSICYQLPALMLPGTSIVISPLVSLMKDQVEGLSANHIPAAYVNSLLTPAQIKKIYKAALEGKYKLLYVAPERLFTPSFKRLCERIEIPLVCIDEAHCVSQWGRDFRPDYLKIRDFVESFPVRPAVAAFTATATPDVRADIINLVALTNPFIEITGFERKNLFFDVVKVPDKLKAVIEFIKGRPGESGIIYCSTRKNAALVCDVLAHEGFDVVLYHAGMSVSDRKLNQHLFCSDEKKLVVATNAFGMGIDKPNVRFVLHYDLPADVEGYYQQAGRAGRDGLKSDCILFYDRADIKTQKYLIQNTHGSPDISQEEAKELENIRLSRLETLVDYCEQGGCFRHYMLNYFGESSPEKCDNCGNCIGHKRVRKAVQSENVQLKMGDSFYKDLELLRERIANKSHAPKRFILSTSQMRLADELRPKDVDTLRSRCRFSERQIRSIGFEIIRLCARYDSL